MLPTAHVEFTWAVLNLLQRKAGLFPDADYRQVAFFALLPDAVDKPLATFVLTDSNAALLFGHTALLHGGAWLDVDAQPGCVYFLDSRYFGDIAFLGVE